MTTSRGKKTVIVMPAYNEATVIDKVLTTLLNTLSSNKISCQVVVVNDGSTDDTSEIIKKLPVTPINHLLNSGAGAATRTGFNYAKKINADYVITMDADGQHAAHDVIKLIKSIKKDDSDFIIGSRLSDKAGMPWYRVLGNKGLSAITFVVFGVFVRDSQSGLRAYNKEAIQTIIFNSNNYAFCSEIIWIAHRNKLRIKEIPINAIYTEYSLNKGQTNWGAFGIIRQIVKRRFLSMLYG